MNKIKKLIFTLSGLVLISAALYFVGGKKNTPAKLDLAQFSVADTSAISQIVITSPKGEIQVKRVQSNWTLNDEFKADPALIQLVHTILNRAETQRAVSKINFEDIKNDFLDRGKKINISFSNGENFAFYSCGNATKTVAYFGTEDLSEIYIVAIPGYNSYLSGVFELTAGQWRDRILFSTTWRTLQSLEIDYLSSDQSSLSISFDSKFLAVEGVNDLDTAVLMNFLQPLEYFQLNDYLDKGLYPKYDSLLDVSPLASLTLKDIDVNKNRNLVIYPKIAGERFYLMKDGQGQMIVVDENRMNNLLASPQLFQKK